MTSIMFWITTLHPVFLFMLTFLKIYFIAFLVLLLARKIVSTKMWAPVQTPMMQLTGVFLALLLAFLATNVWKDLADAKSAVEHEVNAAEKVAMLSVKLSPQERAGFLKNMAAYLRLVADQEWEIMKKGSEDAETRKMIFTMLDQIDSFDIPPALAEKMSELINDIAVYRSNRLTNSHDIVSPVTWVIVLLQAGLIMLTVALVHYENHQAQCISLAIVSSVIASVIFLILFYDQPFANAADNARETYYQLLKKIASFASN